MAPLLTRCRRLLTALACAALCLPAVASAHGGGRATGLQALRSTGSTVVAALSHSVAGRTIEALDDSLVLLGARWKVERLQKRSASEARAASAAPPRMITDPERMPPASAGSNGSYRPHDAAARGELFAHVRGGGAGDSKAILLSGIALAPPDAPAAVQGVIDNANTIVGRPYVWGGGHGSFYSNGYDCSGSVSFALFGGGLIPEPLTSGALEHWGEPGPGRWITVYANATHTFAEIAGLRWDTVGDEHGSGPRWHLAPASTAGFVARHPPGL